MRIDSFRFPRLRKQEALQNPGFEKLRVKPHLRPWHPLSLPPGTPAQGPQPRMLPRGRGGWWRVGLLQPAPGSGPLGGTGSWYTVSAQIELVS